ncbi:MAG TPA: hypothetical protein VH475_08005 [Tepidisphaeraceae bacterium]|jgi:hypothetical protein
MFEKLEDRQFMSATLLSAPAAPAVNDGTSNTLIVCEAKPAKPKATPPQTYLTLTLENCMISGY